MPAPAGAVGAVEDVRPENIQAAGDTYTDTDTDTNTDTDTINNTDTDTNHDADTISGTEVGRDRVRARAEAHGAGTRDGSAEAVADSEVEARAGVRATHSRDEEGAVTRTFRVANHAPLLTRCISKAGFFAALLASTNELKDCARDESAAAQTRLGKRVAVTCDGPRLLDCTTDGPFDVYRYCFRRRYAPLDGGPHGAFAPLGYVVLPPEKTLGLRGPMHAWRVVGPGVARATLPEASREGTGLRCLSCDGLDVAHSAAQLGRCLEEGLAALDVLRPSVQALHPTAHVRLVEAARRAYLAAPPGVRVLYHEDKIFRPMAHEPLWEALAGSVAPADRRLLDRCWSAASAATQGATLHPLRAAQLRQACLPRAEQLLAPASLLTLHDGLAADPASDEDGFIGREAAW